MPLCTSNKNKYACPFYSMDERGINFDDLLAMLPMDVDHVSVIGRGVCVCVCGCGCVCVCMWVWVGWCVWVCVL